MIQPAAGTGPLNEVLAVAVRPVERPLGRRIARSVKTRQPKLIARRAEAAGPRLQALLANELSRSECLGQAVADEGRSALDG